VVVLSGAPVRFPSALTLVVLHLAVGLAARASDGPGAGPYKLEAGPYAVQTIKELILPDDARGKDLPLRLSHPAGPGPCPVLASPSASQRGLVMARVRALTSSRPDPMRSRRSRS